jgi:hypothetical protein
MVLRYAVANVEPGAVAKAGQVAGLAGSVSAGFGFGAWGVEPTTFLEVATADAEAVDQFVICLLREHGEQAAYRTVDGAKPCLLWNDGKREALVS